MKFCLDGIRTKLNIFAAFSYLSGRYGLELIPFYGILCLTSRQRGKPKGRLELRLIVQGAAFLSRIFKDLVDD